MHSSKRALFSKATYIMLQRYMFGERAVCCIPHPNKYHRGGEDAFFAHAYGIGVADGVGGYAEAGIDPALYTRNVMAFCLRKLKESITQSGTAPALDLLKYGSKKAEETKEAGGCPVTMATIVDKTFASILNLGDCGTIIARDKKLLFQTTSQQHSFNCPYQLPHDSPEVAERSRICLRMGDVFLCASDGVFDNLDVDTLIEHLCTVERDGCKKVAKKISSHASFNANNEDFFSPFAKQAMQHGQKYMGGKLDDITVVVARVTSVPTSGLIEDDSDCDELIAQSFSGLHQQK